jgi:putative lysine decarboxylase
MLSIIGVQYLLAKPLSCPICFDDVHFGTIDEFAEIVTWAQLGIHTKPIGMLNVGGYYDSLLAFFDHIVAEKFVTEKHRAMLLTADQPDKLLDLIMVYQPTYSPKWVDRSEARARAALTFSYRVRPKRFFNFSNNGLNRPMTGIKIVLIRPG